MAYFQAKLRRLGNSWGVIIPQRVRRDYELGDILGFELIPGAISEDIVRGQGAVGELARLLESEKGQKPH